MDFAGCIAAKIPRMCPAALGEKVGPHEGAHTEPSGYGDAQTFEQGVAFNAAVA